MDLFAALRRHEVHHVLIGGLAVSLHGIERATMDIDLALDCEPENLRAMVEVAREQSLQPTLALPLEALADRALLA
ncbi:MAG: hypothetical protein VKO64_09565 [Candidatus Sericytochromatia bacterium]|nr:hypothetical protein [Candidatus Sericytochromatia bacterium]